jgi:uncharacterized protein (TIGR02284 family)
MATTSEVQNIINDLIQLNNDRVAGFEKALADIDDENIDLKQLFQTYAQQSRKNGQELAAIIGDVADVETGTSIEGTLHRVWIDVKSIFGGSDREGILSEAERGEDAIKKAYHDAIQSGALPLDISEKVNHQAREIYSAHDRIKALRDAAKAM